jgi:hypothetical protein
MTVEEAIKMVISGGIVTPPDRRPKSEQEVSLTHAAIYEDLDVVREKEGRPVLIPKGARPEDKLKASSGRQIRDNGKIESEKL